MLLLFRRGGGGSDVPPPVPPVDTAHGGIESAWRYTPPQFVTRETRQEPLAEPQSTETAPQVDTAGAPLYGQMIEAYRLAMVVQQAKLDELTRLNAAKQAQEAALILQMQIAEEEYGRIQDEEAAILLLLLS